MTAVKSLDAPIKEQKGKKIPHWENWRPLPRIHVRRCLTAWNRKALCSVLWQCVDSLPGKQPDVIRSRYKDNMTMKQCGQFCGISEAEAKEAADKSAQKPQEQGRMQKKLRPFLPADAWIYSGALIGNGVERFNHTWTSSTERIALEL